MKVQQITCGYSQGEWRASSQGHFQGVFKWQAMERGWLWSSVSRVGLLAVGMLGKGLEVSGGCGMCGWWEYAWASELVWSESGRLESEGVSDLVRMRCKEVVWETAVWREGDQSTTSGKCWPISVDIRVIDNIGKKLGEWRPCLG